jgi:prophage maintenance system killer protein
MPSTKAKDEEQFVAYTTRSMRKSTLDRIRLISALRKADNAPQDKMEDVFNQALAIGVALLEKHRKEGRFND